MINFLAFNLQTFWKVWLVGAICLFTFGVSEIIDKYADGDGCMTWIALIILAIALYAATHQIRKAIEWIKKQKSSWKNVLSLLKNNKCRELGNKKQDKKGLLNLLRCQSKQLKKRALKMITKQNFLKKYMKHFNQNNTRLYIEPLSDLLNIKDFKEDYKEYIQAVESSNFDDLSGLAIINNDQANTFINLDIGTLDNLELINLLNYTAAAERMEEQENKKGLLNTIKRLYMEAIKTIQENSTLLIASSNEKMNVLYDLLHDVSRAPSYLIDFNRTYNQLANIYDYLQQTYNQQDYIVVDNSVDRDITYNLIVNTDTLKTVASDSKPQTQQQAKKIFNENVSDEIYNLI